LLEGSQGGLRGSIRPMEVKKVTQRKVEQKKGVRGKRGSRARTVHLGGKKRNFVRIQQRLSKRQRGNHVGRLEEKGVDDQPMPSERQNRFQERRRQTRKMGIGGSGSPLSRIGGSEKSIGQGTAAGLKGKRK